jgi:O-antigen/teichoic acid export membrane protein
LYNRLVKRIERGSHLNQYQVFSPLERALSFLAGLVNLIVGLGFFFLPELHSPLWPTSISPILVRFIGAIILGNAAGAFWLTSEHEWARVRPLAIVAVVYGTLVAAALLYQLLWLAASSTFWIYFLIDASFLLVYYGLFIYHDIAPRMARRADHPGAAGRQARQPVRKR